MGRQSDPNAPFQPGDYVLAKSGFVKMDPWKDPVIVLRCRRSTSTRSGWLVQVQNPHYKGPTPACTGHFIKVKAPPMSTDPYRQHIPPDDRPPPEPSPPQASPSAYVYAYVPNITDDRAHWLAMLVARRHPWLAQAGVSINFEQVVITATRKTAPFFFTEKKSVFYLSSSTTIGDVDKWVANLWNELDIEHEPIAR